MAGCVYQQSGPPPGPDETDVALEFFHYVCVREDIRRNVRVFVNDQPVYDEDPQGSLGIGVSGLRLPNGPMVVRMEATFEGPFAPFACAREVRTVALPSRFYRFRYDLRDPEQCLVRCFTEGGRACGPDGNPYGPRIREGSDPQRGAAARCVDTAATRPARNAPPIHW